MTTQQFGSDQNDWIRRLIDEDEGLAYSTYLKQQNLSPGIERFMQGQSGQISNNYAANLGRQIAAGTIPTTSFYNEFLPQNLNIQEYLSRFSPKTKGLGTNSVFGNRTEWGF